MVDEEESLECSVQGSESVGVRFILFLGMDNTRGLCGCMVGVGVYGMG